MGGSRLETVDKDLVMRLQRATNGELRAVALKACRHAIAHVGLADQPVVEGLQRLENKIYGDSTTRSALQALVNSFDEAAWEIEELEKGIAGQENFLAAFSKARAASAVYFALHPDALVGAMEAIYEANTATDDEWAGLRHIVLANLGDNT